MRPVPFGRYELIEQIGSGGMAIVYRAVLAGAGELARPVVIKRVRPELARDPSFSKMLTQEARLYAMLSHPSIIQLQEHGQVGAECFMAMEFVDGVDLRALLARCKAAGLRVPIGVACYIVSEMASALDYAHSLKDAASRPLEIVHRDVSPSNIMVTPQGAVKLLDFGIAKAAEHMRDERTRTGTIKGKLTYFSPEQADGLPLDGRSDIFALGSVFVETLSQRGLFRGGGGDFETLRRVREAHVPPLSTLRDDAGADLQEVVSRMLARLPEDRYANAREVVDALRPIKHAHHGDAESLRRFLDELGPIPRNVDIDSGPPLPALESNGVSEPNAITAMRGSRWPTRLFLGAVALTIVGAGVGSWNAARHTSTPPPPPPVVTTATQRSIDPPTQIDPAPRIDPPALVVAAQTPRAEASRGKHKVAPSHHDSHPAVHHDVARPQPHEDPNDVKDPF